MEEDRQRRIETGVSGLDDILSGGFPAGQMYLIEGDPGTGKTTLAMQFILAGVGRGGKSIYITLSESHDELENSARSHGWNPADLPIAEFVPAEASLHPEEQYTIFRPSDVELSDTIRKLTELIDGVKPDRVVIDSLSELRLLAADPMRYRRQLLALKHFFAGRDCTVLLLDDRTAEGSDTQLQSIAHGVIRLEKMHRSYGVTRRQLEVVKLRGSAFREGFHDYNILRGGLCVYPRLVAQEHLDPFAGERISSNLPGLDQMFGGGINRGSSSLLIGPSGCGKSTLAMVYALAAAQRGERTIVYVFDEVLRTAQERLESLGMPVRAEISKGTLRMIQVDPATLSPGEFAGQIRSDVESNDTRVVVIDSLNGYLTSMPGERDLSVHVHELIAYLNQKGVATFLVYTQHGLVGQMQTEVDISYLSDTVILLRYFETTGSLRKLVSVVKQRVGQHEDTLRELKITPKGVQIGEPLTSFRGVMTGVPELELPAHVAG
ncbi:MAG TPA: ATPase domain-containing protein [Acidobacteriaceae bacterium]|nr:ATPase domain-containing protein [Acidobacteriaceae bacterium]